METKTSTSSMITGDRIAFNYKAAANTFGTISQLGTSIAVEIPVTASAAPDGTAYFIMVGYDTKGRKKLVPDRNIQHSISYDTLNTAGVASGSGLPITIDGKAGYTLRLMRGGINAADKDNEWDKIIAESTLNSTIAAGDNNVWNWLNVCSWTSTASNTYPNCRIIRGYTNSTSYSWDNSSGQQNIEGFRPVLLVDPDNTTITINSITPTHLYEKQHTGCTMNISTLDASNLPKDFSIKIGSIEVSALGPSATRTIPINAFEYGSNLVTIISDDVSESFIVERERSRRSIAYRTMTALDGGYDINNVSLHGTATSINGSTAILQTTELTGVNLQNCAGINNLVILATGGTYALSFDSRITWKVKTITSLLPTDINLCLTSTNTPIGTGFQEIGVVFDGNNETYDLFRNQTNPGVLCTFNKSTYIDNFKYRVVPYSADVTFEAYCLKEDNTWVKVHSLFINNGIQQTHNVSMPEECKYTLYKALKIVAVVSGVSDIYFFNAEIYEGVATREWQTIQESEIPTEGMTVSEVNNLTTAEWASIFQRTQLDLYAVLNGADTLTGFNVYLPDNHAPLINNLIATPTIHGGDVILTAELFDAEGEISRYRVTVNDVVVQDWTLSNYINHILSNNLFIPGLNPVVVTAIDTEGGSSSATVYVTKQNTEPYKTTGVLNMLSLLATIADAEGDPISYRIIVNGTTVQDWSVFVSAPLTINYVIDRALINFEVVNTITVEFKDIFASEIHSYTESFIGSYYGILFADEFGSYYSTDAGVILQRADMGPIVVGSAALPITVKLINTTGIALKSVTLNVDVSTVADNTSVKLSYDGTSFDGKDVLVYSTLSNGSSVDFQLQVAANSQAQTGSVFRIIATGEPF